MPAVYQAVGNKIPRQSHLGFAAGRLNDKRRLQDFAFRVDNGEFVGIHQHLRITRLPVRTQGQTGNNLAAAGYRLDFQPIHGPYLAVQRSQRACRLLNPRLLPRQFGFQCLLFLRQCGIFLRLRLLVLRQCGFAPCRLIFRRGRPIRADRAAFQLDAVNARYCLTGIRAAINQQAVV